MCIGWPHDHNHQHEIIKGLKDYKLQRKGTLKRMLECAAVWIRCAHYGHESGACDCLAFDVMLFALLFLTASETGLYSAFKSDVTHDFRVQTYFTQNDRTS